MKQHDILYIFLVLPSSAQAQAQLDAELALILKYPASAQASTREASYV